MYHGMPCHVATRRGTRRDIPRGTPRKAMPCREILDSVPIPAAMLRDMSICPRDVLQYATGESVLSLVNYRAVAIRRNINRIDAR